MAIEDEDEEKLIDQEFFDEYTAARDDMYFDTAAMSGLKRADEQSQEIDRVEDDIRLFPDMGRSAKDVGRSHSEIVREAFCDDGRVCVAYERHDNFVRLIAVSLTVRGAVWYGS